MLNEFSVFIFTNRDILTASLYTQGTSVLCFVDFADDYAALNFHI